MADQAERLYTQQELDQAINEALAKASAALSDVLGWPLATVANALMETSKGDKWPPPQ